MLSLLYIFLSMTLLRSAPLPAPGKEDVGPLSDLHSIIGGITESDVGENDTTDDAGLEDGLSLVLKQSQGLFDSEGSGKPFGLDGFYLQESPSFSDFNNLFKRKPSQPKRQPPAIEEVGDFAPLGTGEPWDKFRNIFRLYSQPGQEGFAEIFGPVYDENQGCGLCHLFPSFEEGEFVTLELITEAVQNTSTYQEYELLPGGHVSLLNDTTIQVLDDNGSGVFFKLNRADVESSEGDDAGSGPSTDRN